MSRPIFKTSKNAGIYVRPRDNCAVVTGIDGWYGTRACLIRSDAADERMKKPSYADGFKTHEATEADTRRMLDVAFSSPLKVYKKVGETRHHDQHLLSWVKVGTYEGDGEQIHFDLDLNPPDRLFGSTAHTIFVDSKDRESVKVLITPYQVK